MYLCLSAFPTGIPFPFIQEGKLQGQILAVTNNYKLELYEFEFPAKIILPLHILKTDFDSF